MIAAPLVMLAWWVPDGAPADFFVTIDSWTRALTVPDCPVSDDPRTRMASPFEPFRVLLWMSTVWVPMAPVTTRLPPAAAAG